MTTTCLRSPCGTFLSPIASNFQSTYLKVFFGFMGVTDVSEIEIRGTLSGNLDANKEMALKAVADLAATF